jgi:hypothetical protein
LDRLHETHGKRCIDPVSFWKVDLFTEEAAWIVYYLKTDEWYIWMTEWKEKLVVIILEQKKTKKKCRPTTLTSRMSRCGRSSGSSSPLAWPEATAHPWSPWLSLYVSPCLICPCVHWVHVNAKIRCV